MKTLIKNINKLPLNIKKKVLIDLKNICKSKKILDSKFNDLPILMGVLNLTPDSFSDGGKFNNLKKAKNHIHNMIKAGADTLVLGSSGLFRKDRTIKQSYW